MGRRAKKMLPLLEGFDIIIKSRFPRLKYTGHTILSPKLFVWCVRSELQNTRSIVAPRSWHINWSTENHHTYDTIN
jgi:hypothetical protein